MSFVLCSPLSPQGDFDDSDEDEDEDEEEEEDEGGAMRMPMDNTALRRMIAADGAKKPVGAAAAKGVVPSAGQDFDEGAVLS